VAAVVPLAVFPVLVDSGGPATAAICSRLLINKN
jgi:hypothetical protein